MFKNGPPVPTKVTPKRREAQARCCTQLRSAPRLGSVFTSCLGYKDPFGHVITVRQKNKRLRTVASNATALVLAVTRYCIYKYTPIHIIHTYFGLQVKIKNKLELKGGGGFWGHAVAYTFIRLSRVSSRWTLLDLRFKARQRHYYYSYETINYIFRYVYVFFHFLAKIV